MNNKSQKLEVANVKRKGYMVMISLVYMHLKSAASIEQYLILGIPELSF